MNRCARSRHCAESAPTWPVTCTFSTPVPLRRSNARCHMAEVLVQFDSSVKDPSGRGYTAKVCGRENEDGLWEGWIEFDAGDGSTVLRTPRETTQPKHTDLEYWAGGLTGTYLEGALRRAIDPETPDLRIPTVDAKAAYDRPASRADQQPA